MQVICFIGAACAEADDETDDGCYAGTIVRFGPSAGKFGWWWGVSVRGKENDRTRDRRRRWPKRLLCAELAVSASR